MLFPVDCCCPSITAALEQSHSYTTWEKQPFLQGAINSITAHFKSAVIAILNNGLLRNLLG